MEIFFSYSWSQKDICKLIHSKLIENGYKVWLDIEQINGGDQLYDKIITGISDCKIFICCCSLDYIASENCSTEISLAGSWGKNIIPLMVEKLPDWPPKTGIARYLVNKLYIDFTNTKQFDGKLKELIQAIKRQSGVENTIISEPIPDKKEPTPYKKIPIKAITIKYYRRIVDISRIIYFRLAVVIARSTPYIGAITCFSVYKLVRGLYKIYYNLPLKTEYVDKRTSISLITVSLLGELILYRRAKKTLRLGSTTLFAASGIIIALGAAFLLNY